MWTAGGYPKQYSRFSGRDCMHTTLLFHLGLSVCAENDGKHSDHSVHKQVMHTSGVGKMGNLGKVSLSLRVGEEHCLNISVNHGKFGN